MQLTSPDFENNGVLPRKAVSSHLGGQDKSPVLSFSQVPSDAKSLALTCYDPDAPTGSGFWHWIVVNIPVQTEGTLCSESLPPLANVVFNDANEANYMGALPPADDPAHRYIFTLHALSCERIEIEGMAQAFVRFQIKTNEIMRASMTALFANTESVSL